MKQPSIASLKRVTPENLARLGADRLALILTASAESRPELKRQLRMELAAEHGAGHLTPELDKRLTSLTSSRSRVSWRQRPTFIRDLDVLRALISERLGQLDASAAVERLLTLLNLAPTLNARIRDKHDELAEVLARAAEDLGALLAQDAGADAAELAEAIGRAPIRWAAWLPAVLRQAPAPFTERLSTLTADRRGPGWPSIVRLVAEAAGDMDVYLATYASADLRNPEVAAGVAIKLMDAGRVAEAGAVLQGAAPVAGKRRIWPQTPAAADPDLDWESAQIRWLDLSGRTAEAQEARWAIFARNLSVNPLREFTKRLAGFDDVEAEERAFDHAAAHPDFQLALAFFMQWPSLPRAAQLISARAEEAWAESEDAELWAARLGQRWPTAANTLLRKSAARAFQKRDYATSTRLTEEADALGL